MLRLYIHCLSCYCDVPFFLWKLTVKLNLHHFRLPSRIRRELDSTGLLHSSQFFYFNPCTVHLSLFCTLSNKCTIISQIITFLHVSTSSYHPQGACNQYLAKLNSCIWNTCAIWKVIYYRLPEDDTIVSKHVNM